MKRVNLRRAALILAAMLVLSGCRSEQEFIVDTSSVSVPISADGSSVGGSEDTASDGSQSSDPDITDVGSVGGEESSSQPVQSSSVSESSGGSESSEVTSSQVSSSSGAAGSSSVSSVSSFGSKPQSSSSVGASGSRPHSSSSSSSSSARPQSSSSSSSHSFSTGGISCSWKIGNTWSEGGKKCGTAELTISNNSGKNIEGWNAKFSVPSGFSISNGWSGTYNVSGTTVTVTDAGYNKSIPNGSGITVGFNYSCPGDFTPPSSVTFNGNAAGSSPSSSQGGQGGQGSQGGQTSSGSQGNEPVSTDIKEMLTRDPNAKQGDDWLHVSGNKILDRNGKEVWLTGVNWFGYNTGTNIFDGLWNSNLRSSVKAIADHGFNLIRVPISAELINQWSRGEYPRANYNNALNPELNALNSLQIFEYFLKLAEQNGMKVMPDIHCAETDAQGHNVNLWYTSKVTVDDYYHALEWLAERYKNNDTIIAIDLKNEPHGKPNEQNKAIWNNSTDINNWKHTAEIAAGKILAINPNVLIMVEGTEIYSKNNGSYTSTNSADYYFNWWGGNLRGVKDYPVNLGAHQDKLVYSPHDYGPTVYEQPWFKGGYDYDSLIRDCWQDNWLYIHQTGTAPLLIGEWGGFMREPNLTWMTCMRRLIKENRLNHTFWCFNANSGDTGGLVLDDFVTWDTEKYNFVKEVLWQENGKFVGLDHRIPLGENGVSISEL